MFNIGEFSKLTQLSIKTLRFYHEEGLLAPACVDPDTGYRYYDERQIDGARAIVYLRSLEFSLSEIKRCQPGRRTRIRLARGRLVRMPPVARRAPQDRSGPSPRPSPR